MKSSSFKIFLVEDDVWYAEILEYHLSMNPDYDIEKFSTAQSCLQEMYRRPNMVCMDYSLPDMTGKELLKKLQKNYGNIPVVIVSGQEDIKTAVEVLQESNVHDYLVKDDDTKDRLWKAVIKIKELNVLEQEVEELKEELGKKYDFNEAIKGNSPAMVSLFARMVKACDNNITVSITGETGTGKELAARCIHYNSGRQKKSFVAVNMSAIPSELIESELFGHEKGAFTGAHTRRIGKFEEANKGTIFLDEIADMDLATQTKMLRVLQERELTRVGGNSVIKLDVRVIVATHKNLAQEVREGRFREDLYFRILGLPIELPPLRERKNDVLILAKYFADSFCKNNNKKKKVLSQDAKSKLLQYHYPGNVRELKAVVELSCVMSDTQEIQDTDITFNSLTSFSDFILEENTLKGYTAKIVQHFMDKYQDDVAMVAQKLDIGKSTLYKMIKRGDV